MPTKRQLRGVKTAIDLFKKDMAKLNLGVEIKNSEGKTIFKIERKEKDGNISD